MTIKEKTALYRCFSEDGLLIYVGISFHPLGRIESHEYQSEWISKVSSISVTWHESRKMALEAERKAVESESPLFNVLLRQKKSKATKPLSTKIKFVGFRMDEEQYKALVLRSKEMGRTVSGLLRWLVRKLLET